MKGTLCFYLMFYVIVTSPVLIAYIIYTYASGPSAADMSEIDQKVNTWFKVEVAFLIIATCAYALGVILLTVRGDLLERTSSFMIAIIIILKVLYYVWASVGALLYFREVRNAEDSDDNTLNCTLLVLTIINIVDIIRLTMIVLLCTTIHCLCKRRAQASLRQNITN